MGDIMGREFGISWVENVGCHGRRVWDIVGGGCGMSWEKVGRQWEVLVIIIGGGGWWVDGWLSWWWGGWVVMHVGGWLVLIDTVVV